MKRAVWILIGAALGVGLSGDIAGAEADPVEAARLAVRTKQFSRAVELLRAPANRELVEARYLL